jgi:hypothetical protein
MSGRFSFTAGNTLTAAQLNTNIMDGVLYKTQVGTSTVSLTSNASWSYGAVNVTNLSGFTVNPYVVATAEATTTTTPVLTHVINHRSLVSHASHIINRRRKLI